MHSVEHRPPPGPLSDYIYQTKINRQRKLCGSAPKCDGSFSGPFPNPPSCPVQNSYYFLCHPADKIKKTQVKTWKWLSPWIRGTHHQNVVCGQTWKTSPVPAGFSAYPCYLDDLLHTQNSILILQTFVVFHGVSDWPSICM